MSDMDPLYESMKASAEDMSKAAVEMKQMMTADENTDVPIGGYGDEPSFSKQLKALVDVLFNEWATENGILTTDANSTSLFIIKDFKGNQGLVLAKDGSLFLRGLSSALQDIVTIKYAGDFNDVRGLFSRDTSSADLWHVDDHAGGRALVLARDGGLFLRGLATALQDVYTIKYAGNVQQAVAQIADMQEKIDSLSATPTGRTFYALDKTGALTTQTVNVTRITRHEQTGYKLNSWPQGKLCVDSLGRIYCGYNSSGSHGASNSVPMLKYSDDNGITWSNAIQIVTGESFARGTDWWSLGVDSNNTLWGIVRSRGANNQVGVTFHNIYKSTDRGLTWTKVGLLSMVSQTIDGVDYVPELFHDMCYIPTTGRMITGYHFASSSRVGFLSFDITDPLNTTVQQDVIAHGDLSGTIYVEPTIAVEYDRVSTGTVYGGLRTQTNAYPSQLYFMNPDLTGFTRFNAPESVQYSPMAIRRTNGQFILLTIERYNTGTMNLWFGSPTDFYNQNSAGFYKMKIGQIVKEQIVGSSNVGVQDMEIMGEDVLMAWSYADNTYSDTYLGRMNVVRSDSYMTFEYLEGM